MIELHGFAKSSSVSRVRIALALKNLRYTDLDVDLSLHEQHESAFRALNPQAMVPVYNDDNSIISQSLAIIEYLDERYPEPPLLPRDLATRARARQYANIIVSDIAPFATKRVAAYLDDGLGLDEAARQRWLHYWLLEGLDSLELWLASARSITRFSVGNEISIADICLVPQLTLARRLKLDVEDFPRLCSIEAACLELDAFTNNLP